MRKVSRADETYDVNFRTATSDYCATPKCYNKPEGTGRHCATCIETVKNPTSRPYDTKGTTSSVKTAGAWPSEVDHNAHIDSMQELLEHHTKGVVWHHKQKDDVQAGRHAAAVAALTGAIEACKIAR